MQAGENPPFGNFQDQIAAYALCENFWMSDITFQNRVLNQENVAESDFRLNVPYDHNIRFSDIGFSPILPELLGP